MPNNMEQFTKRARQVLSLAQEEAEQYEHAYIGTEHLLLGLMREESGIAGRVLRELGLTSGRMTEAFKRTTRAGHRTANSRLDLAPEAKRVIELAVDEARHFGHHYIGTEQLLLGLVSMSESVAVDMLKWLMVSPDDVRRETRRILQEPPVETPMKSPQEAPRTTKLTDRFTTYATGALTIAYAEAKRLQATTVGTEHLLLALMAHKGGGARQILVKMGLDLDILQTEVAKLASNQPHDENASLELDPKTQEALVLAVDEARVMDLHYVGTEHLLLALSLQRESGAINVLKRLNVSPADLHSQTLRTIKDSRPTMARPPQVGRTQAESSQPRPQTHKMERFTQRARRVLSLSQEEAERLQHSYIGTEHMLIALMREEGGVAGRVLRDLGADPHRVEELVERMTRAEQRALNTRLDLSPGVKRLLELAVHEARSMGHRYIGTEHLLLGLVRQTDGVAIDVLKHLNISPEEVRRQIRRVLQESPVQGRQATATPQPSEVPRQLEPQRFAGEWRITLAIARAEAIRLKSKLIEPEHLLVALLLDEGDRTGKLLRAAGVDLEKVLEQIQASRVIDSEPVLEVEMSPKMVEVLGLATAASLKSHNYYIQVEHLLLGLLRQKENAAIDILKQQNVSLEELQKKTRESLD